MHQPNRSRVGRTPELVGTPEADRNPAVSIPAGGSPAAEPRRDSESDLPVHRRRDRPSGFGSAWSSPAPDSRSPDSSERRSFPATCTALWADSGWNQNRQRETLWSIRFRSAAGRWGGFPHPGPFPTPEYVSQPGPVPVVSVDGVFSVGAEVSVNDASAVAS